MHRRDATRWLIAALVAGLLLPSAARAQEWTRFRGPNGSGISNARTVPVSFTEQDFNWKVELPGFAHSSPVMWGDRIFVTSADEESARRHVFCLNVADGAPVWRKSYPFRSDADHDQASSASATPTVDADRVYVCWTTAAAVEIVALTHAGEEVWSRDLGPFQAAHGSGASPMVDDGVVYFMYANDVGGPDSYYIALDAKTGETVWKLPRRSGQACYATPMIRTAANGAREVIFSHHLHGITAVHPQTGAVLWELSDLWPERTVGSPIEVGGLILGTAGAGGRPNHAVAVRPPAGGRAASVAFKVARGQPFVPTPIAHNGLIFLWGDSGIVTCVRAATGELVYQERTDANYHGSPICIDGKLYAMNDRGEVVVIPASERFEILARNPTGEGSSATPAVHRGVLYLRTRTHLISVGG